MSDANQQFNGSAAAAADGDITAQLQLLQPWLGSSSTETVLYSQCLGARGWWPMRRHSFIYLTSHRIFCIEQAGSRLAAVHSADVNSLEHLSVITSPTVSFLAGWLLILAFLFPTYGMTLLLVPLLPLFNRHFFPQGLLCYSGGGGFCCSSSRANLPKLHLLLLMISELRSGQALLQRGLQWQCPYPPLIPNTPPPPTPFSQPLARQRSNAAAGSSASSAPAPSQPHPSALTPDATGGPTQVVPPASQRAASVLSGHPLSDAAALISQGKLAAAQKVLDQVPATARNVEFDRLYRQTIPQTGATLDAIRNQYQKLLEQKIFAGREKLLVQLLELSPQDTNAASDLQTLRGRRETLKSILQACGNKPPAHDSDHHRKLHWTFQAVDPEADPTLTDRCRKLLNPK
jgi:hypothetical protein